MYSFFPDKVFNFKTHALEYAKQFIAEQIPFNTIIEPSSHNGVFLTKLISYHPESAIKIGSGIKTFTKRPNQCGYTLFIIHPDGSESSFSYKVCFGIKFNDLYTAMRSSIAPFIRDFFKNAIHKCVLCGSINNLQTDHKTIPFSTIKNMFLAKNVLPIPETFSKNQFLNACFRQTDSEFESAWISFHNNNADYQVLCGPCNSKKSDKPNNEKLHKTISYLYINLNDL